MAIQVKNLIAKLLGKKIVKVKNSNGDEIEFEIQRVAIETYAKNLSKIEDIVGKTQEEIKQMLMDQFKSQEISEVIAPVLLEGVSAPEVVDKDIKECDIDKEEVPLKVLLIDLELSTNLYMEILQISVEGSEKNK